MSLFTQILKDIVDFYFLELGVGVKYRILLIYLYMLLQDIHIRF